MIVSLKNEYPELWSTQEFNEAAEALNFAIESLFIETEGMELHVLLDTVRHDQGGCAYVHEDGFYQINISYIMPRKDTREHMEYIQNVIFHEMHHIYQYVFEGLDLGFGENEAKTWVSFKGIKAPVYWEDITEDEYWSLPWEVEAQNAADILQANFEKLKSKKSKKILDKAVK